MTTTTLDQRRAVFARDQIQAVRIHQKRDKILGLVQNLPVRIRHHGLGQTLAFLLAKAERNAHGAIKPGDPHRTVYDWLNDWLCAPNEDNRPCAVFDQGDLLDAIVDADSKRLRRATAESIALAGWLKLLGEALLSGGTVQPAAEEESHGTAQ